MNFNDNGQIQGACAVAPTRKNSPVEECIIQLHNATEVLSRGLNELYDRLNPVLSQIPAKEKSQPVPPQPGSSALVEKLHQIIARVEFMGDSTHFVRTRLEV